MEGTIAELHFSDHKKVLNEKRLEGYFEGNGDAHPKIRSACSKKYKVDVLELGKCISGIIIKSGKNK